MLAPLGTIVAGAARAEEKGRPVNLAADALGVDLHSQKPHTPEQGYVAEQAGRDVVCLCGTCPKRLIHECECGWAAQNRNAIMNAVVDGKTREDIVAAYRRVYGDQVLAMLPNSGFAVTAWALPYAVAAVGLGAAVFVGVRVLKGRGVADASEVATPATPQTHQTVTDDDARRALERELEDLD